MNQWYSSMNKFLLKSYIIPKGLSHCSHSFIILIAMIFANSYLTLISELKPYHNLPNFVYRHRSVNSGIHFFATCNIAWLFLNVSQQSIGQLTSLCSLPHRCHLRVEQRRKLRMKQMMKRRKRKWIHSCWSFLTFCWRCVCWRIKCGVFSINMNSKCLDVGPEYFGKFMSLLILK